MQRRPDIDDKVSVDFTVRELAVIAAGLMTLKIMDVGQDNDESKEDMDNVTDRIFNILGVPQDPESVSQEMLRRTGLA